MVRQVASRKLHVQPPSWGSQKVCSLLKDWKIFQLSEYFFFLFYLDINELNLPRTCTTNFPDPNDLLNFKMIICPDEGYYKGGRFSFNFKVRTSSDIHGWLYIEFGQINNFQVGPNYPHEPPKVKCETKVYHPNIDLEGNVCLNILREDWKPVLTINSIVYGLQYLFLVSCSQTCSQQMFLTTNLLIF